MDVLRSCSLGDAHCRNVYEAPPSKIGSAPFEVPHELRKLFAYVTTDKLNTIYYYDLWYAAVFVHFELMASTSGQIPMHWSATKDERHWFAKWYRTVGQIYQQCMQTIKIYKILRSNQKMFSDNPAETLLLKCHSLPPQNGIQTGYHRTAVGHSRKRDLYTDETLAVVLSNFGSVKWRCFLIVVQLQVLCLYHCNVLHLPTSLCGDTW